MTESVPGAESVPAAVHELLAGLTRAWNSGDGAAWAAHFVADAAFVDVVGRLQRGRDVIAAEHQKIFDTIYRGSRLELTPLDCRQLGDGVLLVHSATALRVPEGPRAGEWQAMQTKVLRDGKIVAIHNTMRTDLADFVHEDEELARLAPREWRRGGGTTPGAGAQVSETTPEAGPQVGD